MADDLGLDIHLRARGEQFLKDIDKIIADAEKRAEKMTIGFGATRSGGGGARKGLLDRILGNMEADNKKTLDKIAKDTDAANARMERAFAATAKRQVEIVRARNRQLEQLEKQLTESRVREGRRLDQLEQNTAAKLKLRNEVRPAEERAATVRRGQLAQVEVERRRQAQVFVDDSLRARRVQDEQDRRDRIKQTAADEFARRQAAYAHLSGTLGAGNVQPFRAGVRGLPPNNAPQAGGRSGRNAAGLFQVQQMVEDFSYAGFRGAANNMAFFASMMGGTGGIVALSALLGINLLIVAKDMGIFGTASKDAAEKTKLLAERMREVAAARLDISVSAAGSKTQIGRDFYGKFESGKVSKERDELGAAFGLAMSGSSGGRMLSELAGGVERDPLKFGAMSRLSWADKAGKEAEKAVFRKEADRLIQRGNVIRGAQQTEDDYKRLRNAPTMEGETISPERIAMLEELDNKRRAARAEMEKSFRESEASQRKYQTAFPNMIGGDYAGMRTDTLNAVNEQVGKAVVLDEQIEAMGREIKKNAMDVAKSLANQAESSKEILDSMTGISPEMRRMLEDNLALVKYDKQRVILAEQLSEQYRIQSASMQSRDSFQSRGFGLMRSRGRDMMEQSGAPEWMIQQREGNLYNTQAKMLYSGAMAAGRAGDTDRKIEQLKELQNLQFEVAGNSPYRGRAEAAFASAIRTQKAIEDTYGEQQRAAQGTFKTIDDLKLRIGTLADQIRATSSIQLNLTNPDDLARMQQMHALMVQMSMLTGSKPPAAIPGMARGGHIPGFSTKDSVPAVLRKGEYVLRSEAVRKIGVGPLNRLNYADRYADGGAVSMKQNAAPVRGRPPMPKQAPLTDALPANSYGDNMDSLSSVLQGSPAGKLYGRLHNVELREAVNRPLRGLGSTESGKFLLEQRYNRYPALRRIPVKSGAESYYDRDQGIKIGPDGDFLTREQTILHELEHSQQGPVKSTLPAMYAREITAGLGDIVNAAEITRMETGKSMNRLTSVGDVDWMRRQAEKHGYFKGRTMTEMLGGQIGQQYMKRLMEGYARGGPVRILSHDDRMASADAMLSRTRGSSSLMTRADSILNRTSDMWRQGRHGYGSLRTSDAIMSRADSILDRTSGRGYGSHDAMMGRADAALGMGRSAETASLGEAGTAGTMFSASHGGTTYNAGIFEKLARYQRLGMHDEAKRLRLALVSGGFGDTSYSRHASRRRTSYVEGGGMASYALARRQQMMHAANRATYRSGLGSQYAGMMQARQSAFAGGRTNRRSAYLAGKTARSLGQRPQSFASYAGAMFGGAYSPYRGFADGGPVGFDQDYGGYDYLGDGGMDNSSAFNAASFSKQREQMLDGTSGGFGVGRWSGGYSSMTRGLSLTGQQTGGEGYFSDGSPRSRYSGGFSAFGSGGMVGADLARQIVRAFKEGGVVGGGSTTNSSNFGSVNIHVRNQTDVGAVMQQMRASKHAELLRRG